MSRNTGEKSTKIVVRNLQTYIWPFQEGLNEKFNRYVAGYIRML